MTSNQSSFKVRRLQFLTLGSLLTGMLITLLAALIVVNQDIDRRLETIRTEQVGLIQQELKARVDTAVSILSACKEQKENQSECLDMLGNIRHGSNNYIWIHRLDPAHPEQAIMLAHPNSALLNRNLQGFVDLDQVEKLYVDGRIVEKTSELGRTVKPLNIFIAFNAMALEKGNGFVQYSWPKIIDGKPSTIGFPKISYIRFFQPWNWVVGAGEYADFIDERIQQEHGRLISERNRLISLLLGLFVIGCVVMVSLTSFIIHNFSRRLHQYQDELVFSSEKIQESERRLYDIASSSGDIIWEIDGTNRYTYISGQTEGILGYPPDSMLHRVVFEHIPDSQIEIFLGEFERHKHRKEPVYDLEQCFVASDGSEKMLLMNARPVMNQYGECTGYRGVYRDITEKKQDGVRQKQMERELQHAQKLEAIGTLAAGIAHEINTPLQFIGDNTNFIAESFHDLQAYMDGIKETLLSMNDDSATLADRLEGLEEKYDIPYLQEEVPKALEQSLDGLAQIRRIVTAMKDYSYQGKEEREMADLNMALETALVISRNEWKHWAEIHREFDPQLPLVPCYIGEIKQVFLNLIVNASHALKERCDHAGSDKGTITVRTRSAEDSVIVEVEDTGAGIPEKIRHRVFEYFFTTKDVGKGTGQGLAIAYHIITEKHQGKISFHSEVNKGTIFTLELPLIAKQGRPDPLGVP